MWQFPDHWAVEGGLVDCDMSHGNVSQKTAAVAPRTMP